MWIFTSFGFFSIVQNHECDSNTLCVRARYADDLDRLRQRVPALGATVSMPERDYEFRAFIDKQQMAEAMARIVTEIDYGNFKARVEEVLGQVRESQLLDVWCTMASPPTTSEMSDLDEDEWADEWDKALDPVVEPVEALDDASVLEWRIP